MVRLEKGKGVVTFSVFILSAVQGAEKLKRSIQSGYISPDGDNEAWVSMGLTETMKEDRSFADGAGSLCRILTRTTEKREL